MVDIADEQLAELREKLHTLNNALNVMSVKAELVRVLASDSASAEEIASSVDDITRECRKSGGIVQDVGRLLRSAKHT